MKLIKHMEAVFVASVAFTVGGVYLVDSLPAAHARHAVVAATANAPVVVVKAKRMTAEEKRMLAASLTNHL